MAYATFDYCARIYPTITLQDYEAYSWESGHEIDRLTSGVDGVKKLKIAFPTDEEDAEAVKRCFCEVLYTLVMIGKEKNNIAEAGGTSVINGRVVPSSIASISSGSESISFANNTEKGQYYTAAVNNDEKNKLLYSIIRKYLAGACDYNGVNLLYGGRYPCGVIR